MIGTSSTGTSSTGFSVLTMLGGLFLVVGIFYCIFRVYKKCVPPKEKVEGELDEKSEKEVEMGDKD